MSAVTCCNCGTEITFRVPASVAKGCSTDCHVCGALLMIQPDMTTTDLAWEMSERLHAVTGRWVPRSEWKAAQA